MIGSESIIPIRGREQNSCYVKITFKSVKTSQCGYTVYESGKIIENSAGVIGRVLEFTLRQWYDIKMYSVSIMQIKLRLN